MFPVSEGLQLCQIVRHVEFQNIFNVRFVPFYFLISVFILFLLCLLFLACCLGQDSSVGIETRYGLDGPGIEFRWGDEIFRTHPDWLWGPPSLLYNGYRVFSGGKAAGVWR